MDRQFLNEKMFVKRLKLNPEVSFLFGSAISAINDGNGIPNVSEVVKILKNYAIENDLLEDYEEFIHGKDDNQIYQESFSFISALKGAKATQEIIKRVVMSNYDTTLGKHKIPKAISDLVTLIKNKKLNVKKIVTTNFDTLIEEKLKEEKIPFNSISIVSDSNISENQNGYLDIIHIHGVWNKGDSMHTHNQLEAKRDKIEASLRNFLTENEVIVMAYSGWVDSFTRTLTNIVNDDKAEYEIAWCFYEKEDAFINHYHKDLFSRLNDAIARDRIKFFKNIDCNVVFKSLLETNELLKKN